MSKKKVDEVYVKSFKNLNDFKIEPNGRNIMLCGKNGTGKSTTTQIIKIASGDDTNIPDDIKGEGVVVMSEDGLKYILKVKIKEGRSIVEITYPDGVRDDKKKSLKSLMGAVDFDINHFVELSKTKKGQKEQVEIFKKFLDKDVLAAIARYEGDVEISYKERTEIGRDLDEIKIEVKNHPLSFMSDEALKVYTFTDVTKLSEELKPLTEHNNKRTPVLARIDERNVRLESIKAEIDKLTKEAEDIGLKNQQAEKWLKEENPEKDTSEIDNKIAKSTENNKKYTEAQDLLKKRGQVKEYDEKYGELTASIDSKKTTIADAIRDMIVPVDGLSFEGDKLMYKGVEVSSASLSTSEIAELGIRLKLAENPDFGILFIGQMESIDDDRMKVIMDLAKEHDLQVIGEMVDRKEPILKMEIIQG